jgi:ketosteroid isomerase-like protein
MSRADFVKHVYDHFNAGDMEIVLAAMQEDVIWANGLEGGHVHGRNGVRSYWTHQWAMITRTSNRSRLPSAPKEK